MTFARTTSLQHVVWLVIKDWQKNGASKRKRLKNTPKKLQSADKGSSMFKAKFVHMF